jgi:FSR family fosmidomycin resistance protein-like MFS transporter
VPLAFFNLFRNPLLECLSTYLPTYMSAQGASLWVAGSSLSIIELAGVAGALTIGMLSDRLGRKKVLFASSLMASLSMLVFLRVEGWWMVPVLLALGFSAFAALPVMLAIVQEQFPNNRAVANGLYMMIIFLLRPLGTLAVGFLGDRVGLQTTFLYAALFSLLTLPVVLTLPETRQAA